MPVPKAWEELVGQKRNLPCPSCRRNTDHEILSCVYISHEEDEDDYAPFVQYYQFVSCLGCHTLSVRELLVNTDAVDPYEYRDPELYCDGKIIPAIEIFDDYRDLTPYKRYIPRNIFRLYTSMMSSAHFDDPAHSGIVIRGIIEQICKHQKKYVNRNLSESIKKLHEAGKITSDILEILSKLKVLGENSVHALFEPSKEQINTALEVIRTMILTFYILPKLARSTLKNIRKKTIRKPSRPKKIKSPHQ